jgi:hypothetical protein
MTIAKAGYVAALPLVARHAFADVTLRASRVVLDHKYITPAYTGDNTNIP